MAITLTQGAAGLSATLRVTGSRSEPRGSTSTPSFECLAGSETFDETSPAIISGTNIARTGIAMTHSTGTFSGTLGSTSIPGTLSIKYNNGTGGATIPVTLARQ
jgi:hypothetical protein